MRNLQGGLKFDITFVIDATASMGTTIQRLKESALKFGNELEQQLENYGRGISQLRMRVIDFADFASEGKDAIHASEFFAIPEEQTKFVSAVEAIKYENRGVDISTNALEALWVAMKSDWVDLSVYARGRHMIILITDSYPRHFGERNGCVGYVADDYPESIQELENIWCERAEQGGGHTKLSSRGKRLFLLAPEGKDVNGHSWDTVSGWEQVFYQPVKLGRGAEDIGPDGFLRLIYDVVAEIVRS